MADAACSGGSARQENISRHSGGSGAVFDLQARQKQVAGIAPVSRINPAQYLTRNGMVCPGGDGRYRVTFLYGDDSKVELSLSARQAGALAVGMRGTLVFRDAVFLSFRPD